MFKFSAEYFPGAMNQHTDMTELDVHEFRCFLMSALLDRHEPKRLSLVRRNEPEFVSDDSDQFVELQHFKWVDVVGDQVDFNRLAPRGEGTILAQ